jgi:hypothetical protein
MGLSGADAILDIMRGLSSVRIQHNALHIISKEYKTRGCN